MTDLWEGTPADETIPDEQTTGLFERPRDREAEHIVLGTIMRTPDEIDEFARVMDPDDFGDDRLGWIWRAVDSLRDEIRGGEIAWHAVHRRLAAWHAAGTMPLVPFDEAKLREIYQWAMPGSAAEHYAEKVAEKAAARRLIDLGLRAQNAGMSPAFDPDVAAAAVQADLDKVLRQPAAGTNRRLADVLPRVYEGAVTPPSAEDRVPTGSIDLDKMTGGGFAPGQLVIIGARPSIGKTTVAAGIARAAAITNGMPTLFVSMEMGAEELGQTIVAAEATVALHHIKHGTSSADDVRRMALAEQRMAAAPLIIDDSTHVTLAHLRQQVRTLVRAEGLRLLVVDYLQLMQAPRAESRQVAVADLARSLKLLAKEFRIPVVVLAQLNRGSEQRADRRPQSSDLRESGAIEQDADIVILLHREDMREPDSPRAGEFDFIVDKHRGGHRGTITLAAQLHYGRVVDMTGGV